MSRNALQDIAVITGGGSEVGAAIAQALHDAGYHVVVTDRDQDKAASVAAALFAAGGRSSSAKLDVCDAEAIERLATWIDRELGGAHVLINNAVLTRATPVLDIDLAEWDNVMAVNVRGTFAASQVFGRRFKAARYGRIINLASLAGQNGGTATGAHYAASKGAVLTLTKVFARELANFGVTVNAIAPGPLASPMVRELIDETRMPTLLQSIPVGKLGEPAFVASIVARLASRDAGFVTGATWDINGGLFMR